MGSLGDHVTQVMYMLIAMVLIVVTMAVAMVLMNTGKRSVNKQESKMETQLSEADAQFYTDYEHTNISGVQLKQLLKQSGQRDCAILVMTLSLAGNQAKWSAGSISGTSEGGVKSTSSGIETTFKGTDFETAKSSQRLPVVQIDIKDGETNPSEHKHGAGDDTDDAAFPVQTAQGSTIYNACLVNYGSLLTNAVTAHGTSGDNYTGTLAANSTGTTGTLYTRDWDDTTSYLGRTIAYKDGTFYTKNEFATSQTGEILRNDNYVDMNTANQTMYIDDSARFDGYVLKATKGSYMGLVFIERVN